MKQYKITDRQNGIMVTFDLPEENFEIQLSCIKITPLIDMSTSLSVLERRIIACQKVDAMSMRTNFLVTKNDGAIIISGNLFNAFDMMSERRILDIDITKSLKKDVEFMRHMELTKSADPERRLAQGTSKTPQQLQLKLTALTEQLTQELRSLPKSDSERWLLMITSSCGFSLTDLEQIAIGGSAPAAYRPPTLHGEWPLSPVREHDEKTVIAGEEDTFIRQFFDIVMSALILVDVPKTNLILVCHIVPTLPPFLQAISSKLGNIVAIIPKATSINMETEKQVIDAYGEKYVGRRIDGGRWDDYLSNGNNACEFLEAKLRNMSGSFLIIDMGGYFARSLLQIDKYFKERLLGVVEDTENGHQDYEGIMGQTTCPIISIARSKLKNTEDYNVGKSIVEATDAVLRTNAHTMLERMKTIGVLGFGKIGRCIAEHLRQKHIQAIIVFDKDVIRQMEAASLGFSVVTRDVLLENSEAIFCATGNKSLFGHDFEILQDNVFIASCTSHDKEFDLSFLRRSQRSLLQQGIDKYYLTVARQASEEASIEQNDKIKRINLINGGNSVNFLYGAINDPYIYSVQAGLIIAAHKLIHRGHQRVPRPEDNIIQELTDTEIVGIALCWLECFERYRFEKNFHINNSVIINTLNENFQIGSVDVTHYLNFLSELQAYKANIGDRLAQYLDDVMSFLWGVILEEQDKLSWLPTRVKKELLPSVMEKTKCQDLSNFKWQNNEKKAEVVIKAAYACCCIFALHRFATHIILCYNNNVMLGFRQHPRLVNDDELIQKYHALLNKLQEEGETASVKERLQEIARTSLAVIRQLQEDIRSQERSCDTMQR